ncbi:hypothetical protein [uncultured Campylobacter sp.]|uniref:hypothetical protein n=1 Tax=uncultured Campylobacter sp. TaxID=218934 RepID=UPI002620A728|nr:hypothetical protein [uncultured Campylobacter sp.]
MQDEIEAMKEKINSLEESLENLEELLEVTISEVVEKRFIAIEEKQKVLVQNVLEIVEILKKRR